MTSPSAPSETTESFSLSLFLLTVAATTVVLLAALWWLAPEVWASQRQASLGAFLGAFFALSFVNCLFEFFFHRYILHTSAVAPFRRFYRQHTLHHALTRIGRRPGRDGRGIVVIENKFPITEPEQGEASFFPWYTLAVFFLILSPIFFGLHLLAPGIPWFFGGIAALVSSLLLYEILHMISHWSFETWAPLIEHPRWGGLWRAIYGFHLRHHAVIDCNESISGFFGLPIADWLFGTCILPKTVYADGEEWAENKFVSPKPLGFIRFLDRWAGQSVQKRRDDARQ